MIEDSSSKIWVYLLTFFVFVALVGSAFILQGCTISMQNISTHGTANDLVDEEQRASPNISPTITALPVTPAI